MATVGIRELKSRLSHYIRRVERGERITITDRGQAVAVIGPAAVSPRVKQLEDMVRTGGARWGGGKPRGSIRPPRLTHGASVADAIIEDRR